MSALFVLARMLIRLIVNVDNAFQHVGRLYRVAWQPAAAIEPAYNAGICVVLVATLLLVVTRIIRRSFAYSRGTASLHTQTNYRSSRKKFYINTRRRVRSNFTLNCIVITQWLHLGLSTPPVPSSVAAPAHNCPLSVALSLSLLFALVTLMLMMLSSSSGGSGSASSSAKRKESQRQRQRESRRSQDEAAALARKQSDADAHRTSRAAAAAAADDAAQFAAAAPTSDPSIDGDSSASSGAAARSRESQRLRQSDSRSRQDEGAALARRQANADAHRDSRAAAAAAADDAAAAAAVAAAAEAAQIEAALLDSFQFTAAELSYAANNFERSPVAALAFLAANTGIANTPEDLGPLLDGTPDPAHLIAAFKRRTEAPLRGCACCGMRTTDCKPLNTLAQIEPHKMWGDELNEFAALPRVAQQVRSTCVIAGCRYMLHPELVDSSPRAAPAPFTAFMCAACAGAHDTIHPLSVRGGCDFGNLNRLDPPLPKLSLVEQCLVRRSRVYRHTIKCNEISEQLKLAGHVVLVQQDAPDELLDGLQPGIEAAAASITIVFAGSPTLLKRAHAAGRFCAILEIRKHVLLRWMQVLSTINPEFNCPRLMEDLESSDFDAALNALPTQIIDASINADADMMQRVDAMCDDVAAVRC